MTGKDRRVRKTKTQLKAGLAGLLKEKGINEITVTELTEQVDINRSTFYLHYRDIYDMMEKIEINFSLQLVAGGCRSGTILLQ